MKDINVLNNFGGNQIKIAKIVGSFVLYLYINKYKGMGLIPLATLTIIKSILSSMATLSGFIGVALRMR